MKKNSRLMNYGKVLLFPIAAYILAELVSSVFAGKHIFETQIDVNNFIRNICISTISAYALAINMTSGRMDLSLGSQQLIGCLIGGNIALKLGWGPFGILGLSMLVGIVSGILVGGLFVIFKLPSFVLGIGVALLFESLAVAYSTAGFQLYGVAGAGLLSETWFVLVIAVIIVILYYCVMQFTGFGLQYNCIRGSQRVALNSGINVTGNVMICYAIAGGLIALAGVLQTGYQGYMSPALNMTSTTMAFTGFVPIFLALFLQGMCPLSIGIPVAVIVFRLISMTLMKFSLASEASTCIIMGILLLMMVVSGLLRERGIRKVLKLRSMEA